MASRMAADEPIKESELKSSKKISSKEVKNFKDLSDKDKVLYALAKKTEGYAGADIEAICREAAIFALREDIKSKEVTMKHFEKALNKVPPSITKDIEKTYEDIGKQFSTAKAKQMLEEKPSYMG